MPQYRRVLWVALAVNAVMFAVEVAGGVASGSSALQADALDFLGDAANYAVSLFVLSAALSVRARASVLKGVTMAAFGCWVVGHALYQASAGQVPEPIVMGVVGILALLSNVAVALLLYRYRSGDSNMRSVWICSRNDAVGNIAVVAAGDRCIYDSARVAGRYGRPHHGKSVVVGCVADRSICAKGPGREPRMTVAWTSPRCLHIPIHTCLYLHIPAYTCSRGNLHAADSATLERPAPARPALFQPFINHRKHHERKQSRRHQATNHYRRKRPLHFGAGASRHRHRDETDARHQCRHEHRAKPRMRALTHRVIEVVPFFAKLIDVSHEDDTVEHRHTKQRDESNRSAEIEVETPQPQGSDPTHQCERYVEHHQQ